MPITKNGYVNNPRWTEEATDRHEPCGYWGKGEEGNYVSTPIYGTQHGTIWEDVSAWIDKGVTPAVTVGALYKLAVLNNKLYGLSRPSSPAPINMYYWNVTAGEWELKGNLIEADESVSNFIVYKEKLTGIFLNESYYDGEYHYELRVFYWTEGMTNWDWIYNARRPDMHDSPALYNGVSLLAFNDEEFGEQMIQSTEALYDVLISVNEGTGGWAKYVSLDRLVKRVYSVIYDDSLYLVMDNELYLVGALSGNFWEDPDWDPFADTYPPLRQVTKVAPKLASMTTDFSSVFVYNNKLYLLLKSGSGWDEYPLYCWNDVDAWVQETYTANQCLEFPIVYNDILFVVDTLTGEFGYFDVGLTTFTAVDTDATFNQGILAVVESGGKIYGLTDIGGSETKLLELGGGFTSWSELIIIGYHDVLIVSPLVIDNPVWPMPEGDEEF